MMRKPTMSALFRRNRNLIWEQVHWFRKRHGTFHFKIDELYAIGCLGFVEACHSHDPKRSRFSTWATFQVRSKLRAALQRKGRTQRPWQTGALRKGRYGSVSYNSDAEEYQSATSQGNSCFLLDLLDELSEDAQTVVKLVLDTPSEITQALHSSNTGNRTASIRVELLNHLTRQGWTYRQVHLAYSEIREALR